MPVEKLSVPRVEHEEGLKDHEERITFLEARMVKIESALEQLSIRLEPLADLVDSLNTLRKTCAWVGGFAGVYVLGKELIKFIS